MWLSECQDACQSKVQVNLREMADQVWAMRDMRARLISRGHSTKRKLFFIVNRFSRNE